MKRILATIRVVLWTLTAIFAVPAGGQTNLALTPGWNLIGNPGSQAISAATTFGTIFAPVTGVSAAVNTVWIWTGANWAFYSPTFSDGGAAFASSKRCGIGQPR